MKRCLLARNTPELDGDLDIFFQEEGDAGLKSGPLRFADVRPGHLHHLRPAQAAAARGRLEGGALQVREQEPARKGVPGAHRVDDPGSPDRGRPDLGPGAPAAPRHAAAGSRGWGGERP